MKASGTKIAEAFLKKVKGEGKMRLLTEEQKDIIDSIHKFLEEELKDRKSVV